MAQRQRHLIIPVVLFLCIWCKQGCVHARQPPPYWPKYGGGRKVQLLDGNDWELSQLPPTADFDSMDPAFRPSQISTNNKTRIPSSALISFNSYPGWYTSEDPAGHWVRMANTVRAGTVNGTKGKPFVISETGAGGIYEWTRNKAATKWTLAYQNKVLGAEVDVAISNENISGIALWHFFDFKVNDAHENNTQCDYAPHVYPPIFSYINASDSRPGDRPGGLNHKGVIDFWRRPKPSYHVVASKYNSTREISTDLVGSVA